MYRKTLFEKQQIKNIIKTTYIIFQKSSNVSTTLQHMSQEFISLYLNNTLVEVLILIFHALEWKIDYPYLIDLIPML